MTCYAVIFILSRWSTAGRTRQNPESAGALYVNGWQLRVRLSSSQTSIGQTLFKEQYPSC